MFQGKWKKAEVIGKRPGKTTVESQRNQQIFWYCCMTEDMTFGDGSDPGSDKNESQDKAINIDDFSFKSIFRIMNYVGKR